LRASIPNLAALLVALICWAGLAIQFNATYAGQHDLVATAWVLLRFFTILTNLALAVIMTRVTLGGKVSAFLLGGITIAILLVGIVYMTLLRGLLELSGGALLADTLLHKVSPIAMTLWWLLFAPRARLKYNAPLWWALYPLVYFAYAIARGLNGDKYPYPFMNVDKLGWTQTMLNAGGIAMAFIIAGFLLVWFDSWRPLGSKRGSR
jgi:hypothetical protein